MESVGSLVGSPWIYAVVALSVLLDVFLPVLPSGVLVPTAAAAPAASTAAYVPDILVLTLCAATASVLGDLVAYRLAWRGGARLDRALARSRRPGPAPVVSLGAGAARHRARDFLPWSALAGFTWAGYSVALGYFGGQWLGATWLAAAVSAVALLAAGAGAGYLMRKPQASEAR
ncbi:VTT domain-containing protein [Streptomyces thermocarboxydus]|uniref:DedA family protein n=1 Tax=Streptomyces thermocarboxydus TaxID=59299 RepID=UPI0031F74AD9